jgi:hypothetical protein
MRTAAPTQLGARGLGQRMRVPAAATGVALQARAAVASRSDNMRPPLLRSASSNAPGLRQRDTTVGVQCRRLVAAAITPRAAHAPRRCGHQTLCDLAPSCLAAPLAAPAHAGPSKTGATRRLQVVGCGIFGIFKHSGSAAVEIYEGLLMLQHRGQDSAGIVAFDGERFRERKACCSRAGAGRCVLLC